jgi:hypothetical protein
VPIYGRHFEPGELQFITTSTYRRNGLFTCQRFRCIVVETLRQLCLGHGSPCLMLDFHIETQG